MAADGLSYTALFDRWTQTYSKRYATAEVGVLEASVDGAGLCFPLGHGVSGLGQRRSTAGAWVRSRAT